MPTRDELQRENAALHERLSRLSEASLRINATLDVDSVLQGVLESACALTDARYGMVTLLSEDGQVELVLGSGLSEEEVGRLWYAPEAMGVYEYLGAITAPLRVPDLLDHLRSRDLPELRPPSAVGAFLAAPVRYVDENMGFIYLARDEGSGEFSQGDEETLVMFASQAALVIANARRHREERRARQDLETLVETSPVGVVVVDARDGEVTSQNREARRIVGDLLMPDGSLGKILELLTFGRQNGGDDSLPERTLAQALSTGDTVRAEEVTFELPGGRRVTALINATPIRSDGGELESVVVTLQDLTELEELDVLRAEFLAMVSHELRTPLSAVKGSITTLLEPGATLDAAETLQFHRIIDAQASHMRKLISDLLDVAGIATGTLPVAPRPVEVVDLVDEARSAFLSSGGTHALDLDIAPEVPLVMADRLRIVQVLNNLLTNAARHSRLSSPIRVSVAPDGVHVAISVTDEGEGVPAERLPQLFRKFVRFESDKQERDLDGTGLGLSICKGIVEAHGGRIRAESEGPGRGARFTFTLPAAGDTAGSADTAPTSRTATPRHGANERLRILALDDDPHSLRHMRDGIASAGYEPMVTADPKEALRLVAENQPHLVLLDLMLPGADGMDLMNDILRTGETPVIFVSAYGQEELVTRALDMGAADYMVKPFSPGELAARIRAALRKRAQLHPAEPYVRGELEIDYAERRVALAGRSIRLTAIEYRTLAELAANAGRVLTYEHLLRRVWGADINADVRPIRTVVSTLRRRLKDNADDPTYIFTEPRVGYRMVKGEEPTR